MLKNKILPQQQQQQKRVNSNNNTATTTNTANNVSFVHNAPPHHVKDVPKTGPLHHRLKNAPIDQIPISKAPRRQKSSRFFVTEKVVLEPTPAFHGKVI